MEKIFNLNTDYVRKEKGYGCYGVEKWKREGKVILLNNDGFTKIVVNVEENLVEEIKTLDLNLNPVMEIEGAERLARVRKIHCDRCGLKSVPRWIQKFSAIEEVYLNNNDIDSLPRWITQIQTVKTFYVSMNESKRETMIRSMMVMMMIIMIMMMIMMIMSS